MTVIIKNCDTKKQMVKPSEMIEGKAYVDKDGIIYICNRYSQSNIVAFSICGRFLIFSDSIADYFDCTIEINRTE